MQGDVCVRVCVGVGVGVGAVVKRRKSVSISNECIVTSYLPH